MADPALSTVEAPYTSTGNEDIVRHCQRRFEYMASDRWRLEAVWRDVTALAFPQGPRWEDMESRGGRTFDPVFQESKAARRGRTIYDSTLITASGRLAAGVESMITPQAQRWHGLTTEAEYIMGTEEAPGRQQMNIDEEGWSEDLTNYMFMSRYDPRSGFLGSHQMSIYSTVTLGTGVMYLEENYGTLRSPAREVPVKYIPCPLNECFLGVNAQLEHDTCYRMFRLSARQAADKFGENALSSKLRLKAGDAAQQEERYDILHAVFPREAYDGNVRTMLPFMSVYIEMDTKHLIGMSGFQEFPYIIYTWSQTENQPYGDSPAFVVLPEAKSLQEMGKDALLASQNNIRPAVATAMGLEQPVNLNPGMINPQMIDPNTGRLLVQRIMDPVSPELWEATREILRNQVREGMYTNLFQVTNDTQYRTATEAAIRDAEKAELLGPASTRIQKALAAMVDREIGILERKGAFRPGSALQPPDTLAGRNINVRFTSPIDRARRISEVTGMQQTMEFAGMAAQFDPKVTAALDFEEMLHIARGLFGAPAKSMKDQDELAEEKAATEQAEQAGQMAMLGQASGKAAKNVGDGMTAMQDAMAGAGIDPSTLTGVPGQ